MSEPFAANIKTLRRIRGVTQQKLSEQLGVSRTTVSAWENHVSEPDFSTLQKLRDYLNVCYDDLLDD